jgi:hypothetical protein
MCGVGIGTLSGKRVLISQGSLFQFGGSELVTLELVEHLVTLGAEVTVVTNVCGGDVEPIIRAMDHVSVFELGDPLLNDHVERNLPDFAWIQHSVIPEALLRTDAPVRFIFNHMSGFVSLEFPLSPDVEIAKADVVLFNAPATRATHLATGLYAELEEGRAQLFQNPAPEQFARAVFEPPQVPRVLVVSNHIPEEVIQAIDLLGSDVDVELVGSQTHLGARPQRFTGESLNNVSAVVTIGKTVQYCITAAVPVYCYDHFGGPGWVNTENVDAAAFDNFSGRGFERKSAEEIAAEIREQLPTAKSMAVALRDQAGNQYALATRLAEIFTFVEQSTHSRQGKLSPAAISAHLIRQESLRSQWRGAQILQHQRDDVLATHRSLLDQHLELGRLNYELSVQLTELGDAYHQSLVALDEERAQYQALRLKVDRLLRLPGARIGLRSWRWLRSRRR